MRMLVEGRRSCRCGICDKQLSIMLNSTTLPTAGSRPYRERDLMILMKYLAVAVQCMLFSNDPKI